MKDMNTCATCRFMAAKRYPEDAYSRCVRVLHGNGGDHGHLEYKADPKNPAIVTDGSGYAASLRVLPTFGCILHEPGSASAPTPAGEKT